MIDLRSDVLGGCPPEAVAALVAAAREPPGFAAREDRFQRALEMQACEIFGMQDALFVPTGTMANQIAVRLHCARGGVLLADAQAHVAVQEVMATEEINGAIVRRATGP